MDETVVRVPRGGRLYGRERECAQVDRLIATVRRARSASLAVTGEPGIGKTALLAYAAQRAGPDARVVFARGVRDEGDVPFATLDRLLRPLPVDAIDLPPPQRTALASALSKADAPPAGVDRFAVGAAVLNVLAAEAQQRPVLVILDDVQWVDEPSLNAVVFAARRLERDRVGFLFGSRDATGAGLSGVAALGLGGLDVTATGALLADLWVGLAPERVARLVAQTGGNPLALVELPALVDIGGLDRLGSGPEPLPIGLLLEDAYGEQIDRLSLATRRSLLIGALLHDAEAATFFAALARAGVKADDLAAAEDVGLVAVSPAGLAFGHPLIRSAVVQRAAASQLRAAHRWIAEALAEDPSGAARTRRAWHLAAAAYGPDEEVAAALHTAGDRAMRVSGYGSAASAYEKAAKLSVAGELRAARLFAAAGAAFNAGRTDGSARLLDEALGAAPGEEVRVEIEALRGRVQTRSGDPATAYVRLVAEADRLRERRPDLAVKLLANAFAAAVFAGRAADARTVTRDAVALSAAVGGTYSIYSQCALIIVRVMTGEAADTDLLDETLVGFPPAAQIPAEALPMIGDIAYGYTLLDAFERATALHELLKSIAAERAAAGLMVWPVGEQALVDFRTGKWRTAYAGVLEAERLAMDAGLENEVANNRQLRAWIAAARGHADECRRVADQVLAQAGRSGAAVLALLAHCVLGLLELGLGRPDQAIRELERARALATSSGFLEAAHFQWSAELVESYVQCGRTAEAVPLVEALEEQARRTGRPIVAALAARARGLITADDRFADHFSRAVDAHRLAGRPFELARTELCFGQRLRRRRSRADARVHLRAAWETFGALGADCWTARAHAELQATGVQTPERPSTGVDLLTPQELQVALIVREGASNRQAADRLFVSLKTVEYHLSHIYRKLGIASRTELGAALARVRP